MMQNGDKHFKDWRLVDEAKLWSSEDLLSMTKKWKITHQHFRTCGIKSQNCHLRNKKFKRSKQ